MEDPRKLLSAALKESRDVDYVLQTAWKLMDNILGSGHRYAAFHYRSGNLEEGRRSPFSIGVDKSRENVLRLRQPNDKVDDKRWVYLFLENLLRSYLYIFGRDSSFSENYIIATERRIFRDTTVTKTKKKETTLIDQPFSLRIRTTETTSKKVKPSQEKNRDVTIEIPKDLYECLSWHKLLSELLWDAVAEVLRFRAKQKDNNWDRVQNFDIPEYRMVKSVLEDKAKTASNGVGFSQLRNRAISAAHYLFDSNVDCKPILYAEKKFFKLMEHRKDQDRDFFFRVIQAACVFTELLGENLTVFPFRSVVGEPEAPPQRGTTRVRTTLSGHVENSVREAWERLATLIKSREVHCLDLWSGLTVYWDSQNHHMQQKCREAIEAIQLLSASLKGTLSKNGVSSDGNLRSVLSPFLEQAGKDAEESASKAIADNCEPDKHRWVISALAAADGLRGMKHEGKHLTVNIAVGTEVEFRAALVPVYKFKVGNENIHDTQIPSPADNSKEFQRRLRSLVRRNYSLIDARFRFVCIVAKPDEPLELCYIADAMEAYHASTLSETLKKVVMEGRFALARIEPSGKAVVSLRCRDGNYRSLFYCPPGARGFRSLDGPESGGIHFSSLKNQLAELNKADSWKKFVDDTLVPTIEEVSESPTEGGIVVVVPDLELLTQNGAKTSKYFRMPEGRPQLCLEPDDDIEYAERDTFRRLVIQDGATVVDAKSRRIHSRIQLLGGLGEKDFERVIDDNVGEKVRGTLAEWGTRHLSALQFVATILKEEGTKKQLAHCFVISQDGEVQYMTNKSNRLFVPIFTG